MWTTSCESADWGPARTPPLCGPSACSTSTFAAREPARFGLTRRFRPRPSTGAWRTCSRVRPCWACHSTTTSRLSILSGGSDTTSCNCPAPGSPAHTLCTPCSLARRQSACSSISNTASGASSTRFRESGSSSPTSTTSSSSCECPHSECVCRTLTGVWFAGFTAALSLALGLLFRLFLLGLLADLPLNLSQVSFAIETGLQVTIKRLILFANSWLALFLVHSYLRFLWC